MFALFRGSRAVFQFYPESPDQIELITTQETTSNINEHFLHKTFPTLFLLIKVMFLHIDAWRNKLSF